MRIKPFLRLFLRLVLILVLDTGLNNAPLTFFDYEDEDDDEGDLSETDLLTPET
jgi:hypothetical protein